MFNEVLVDSFLYKFPVRTAQAYPRIVCEPYVMECKEKTEIIMK